MDPNQIEHIINAKIAELMQNVCLAQKEVCERAFHKATYERKVPVKINHDIEPGNIITTFNNDFSKDITYFLNEATFMMNGIINGIKKDGGKFSLIATKEKNIFIIADKDGKMDINDTMKWKKSIPMHKLDNIKDAVSLVCNNLTHDIIVLQVEESTNIKFKFSFNLYTFKNK